MPLATGVGILELLLLIAVVRDEIRKARRKLVATPQDDAPRVPWLVVISSSLLIVGFICVIAGGALIVNAEDYAGKASLILGLCFSLSGCAGEISWSLVEQRATRQQQVRAELLEASGHISLYFRQGF